MDLYLHLFGLRPNASSQSSLELRLKRFLDLEATSESLDAEKFCEAFGSRKRADYLLNNRKIIAELKTLNSPPTSRLSKRLRTWLSRPEAPIAFGQVGVAKVLDYFPDGELLKKEIFDLSGRAVRQSLQKADVQIASTKSCLSVDSSSGLLILMNESEPGIDIQTIALAIRSCILDKENYKNISYVMAIVESHKINVINKGKYFPLIFVTRAENIPESDGIFFESLVSYWALFNNSDVISIEHHGSWDALDPVFEDGPVVLDPFE